jgi:hypothetical protein
MLSRVSGNSSNPSSSKKHWFGRFRKSSYRSTKTDGSVVHRNSDKPSSDVRTAIDSGIKLENQRRLPVATWPIDDCISQVSTLSGYPVHPHGYFNMSASFDWPENLEPVSLNNEVRILFVIGLPSLTYRALEAFFSPFEIIAAYKSVLRPTNNIRYYLTLEDHHSANRLRDQFNGFSTASTRVYTSS